MSRTRLRLFAAICSYTESLETVGELRTTSDADSELDLGHLGRSPRSASKYSRCLKLNIPARMFDGNVWILVLYFSTLSL